MLNRERHRIGAHELDQAQRQFLFLPQEHAPASFTEAVERYDANLHSLLIVGQSNPWCASGWDCVGQSSCCGVPVLMVVQLSVVGDKGRWGRDGGGGIWCGRGSWGGCSGRCSYRNRVTLFAAAVPAAADAIAAAAGVVSVPETQHVSGLGVMNGPGTIHFFLPITTPWPLTLCASSAERTSHYVNGPGVGGEVLDWV
jgi:hypothetical protein